MPRRVKFRVRRPRDGRADDGGTHDEEDRTVRAGGARAAGPGFRRVLRRRRRCADRHRRRSADHRVEVVVQAKIAYRNRTDQAAPVLDYGLDYFQRFEPLTAGDALKRVPSVAFLSDVLESDGVRLRGLDPAYTQILINGEKVPGAGPVRARSAGADFGLLRRPHPGRTDRAHRDRPQRLGQPQRRRRGRRAQHRAARRLRPGRRLRPRRRPALRRRQGPRHGRRRVGRPGRPRPPAGRRQRPGPPQPQEQAQPAL